MAYLLFDIGGTKTRLALSEDGKTFGVPEIFATPKNFDEGMRMIEERARTLAEGQELERAAGGISGTLNPDKTTLTHATHLPEWVNEPLLERLQIALDTTVTLENDTAVVGLGEAMAGAGRGFGVVVYLTVSTGVGGVKIERGKIDSHTFGFEPGFQIINEATGETLESAISGTAIAKKYGKAPREITDQAVWDECARILAVGVHNAILHWSPEVVVIGGSMMKAPAGINVAAVTEHLAKLPNPLPVYPPLKAAALGDLGGIHGALALLSE